MRKTCEYIDEKCRRRRKYYEFLNTKQKNKGPSEGGFFRF